MNGAVKQAEPTAGEGLSGMKHGGLTSDGSVMMIFYFGCGG